MWVLIQAWFKLNSIVLFCGRRNSEMTENVNLATLITIDTPVLSEQATLKHTTFEQNLSFPHIYCSLTSSYWLWGSNIVPAWGVYKMIPESEAAPTPTLSLWPQSGLKNVWALTDCAWLTSVWPSEHLFGCQILHMYHPYWPHVFPVTLTLTWQPSRRDNMLAVNVCDMCHRLPTIFDIFTMRVKSCSHYIFITRLLKCRSRPSISAFVNMTWQWIFFKEDRRLCLWR